MTRIPFEEMHAVVRDAFVNAGMNEHDARACARVHTESSCDGIYSHGLNRVARFVDYVRRGWIDLDGRPTPVKRLGAHRDARRQLRPRHPQRAARDRPRAGDRGRRRASASSRCATPRTGCAAAPTAGAPPSGATSRSLDQHRVVHAGLGRDATRASATTRSSWRYRARRATSSSTWRCRSTRTASCRSPGSRARRCPTRAASTRRRPRPRSRGRSSSRCASCRRATGRARASRSCSTRWPRCSPRASRPTRSTTSVAAAAAAARRSSSPSTRASWAARSSPSASPTASSTTCTVVDAGRGRPRGPLPGRGAAAHAHRPSGARHRRRRRRLGGRAGTGRPCGLARGRRSAVRRQSAAVPRVANGVLARIART